MTADQPTLVDFLLARISEDEAVARDSLAIYGPGSSLYIAGHDPARVLAECEAKRRIVEMIWASPLDITTSYGRERLYTLFHLALPYADHPDYREEWKP